MIEPPDLPEVPHKHTHSNEHGAPWFDRALGVAVLLISAASVWSAHETGETMKALVGENARLVRAQSTPFLELATGNRSDAGQDELEFSLVNYGTGPARIVWLEVSVDGHRILDSSGFLNSVDAHQQSVSSSPVASTLLKIGEERRFFTWRAPPKDDPNRTAWDRLDEIRRSSGGLRGEACYCSLLDQCWISKLDSSLPAVVPSCDPGAHQSFAG